MNGDPRHSAPYIINLAFPGLVAEVVIDAWQDLVAVSNGAACTTQQQTCSHVLDAMQVPAWRSDGAVRLSWGASTPEPEWPALVAAVDAQRAHRAAAEPASR